LTHCKVPVTAAVAAQSAAFASAPQGLGSCPNFPSRCAGGAPLLRARMHAAAAHAAACASLRLLLKPSGSFDWTPRALLVMGAERCAPLSVASQNEPVAAVLLRRPWDAAKGEARFASARARALDELGGGREPARGEPRKTRRRPLREPRRRCGAPRRRRAKSLCAGHTAPRRRRSLPWGSPPRGLRRRSRGFEPPMGGCGTRHFCPSIIVPRNVSSLEALENLEAMFVRSRGAARSSQ
jgi:hypothetical protein